MKKGLPSAIADLPGWICLVGLPRKLFSFQKKVDILSNFGYIVIKIKFFIRIVYLMWRGNDQFIINIC